MAQDSGRARLVLEPILYIITVTEPVMDELTPRQQQILRLISERIADGGLPPTRAEICSAMGFRSPNAAEEHLRALERKGAIEMLAGASRGIRLKQQQGIPVVGRVAAGSPILAEQHIEDHYRVDPALFKPRADYLLRVRGASMRDAGIFDGDLLAVHRTGHFRSGQVVVARLQDEVTVKRIRQRRHLIELVPENPDFKTIIVDTRRQPLVIEGIAVGIVRSGKL
ncbi:LexA repressor [compost metagenome]